MTAGGPARVALIESEDDFKRASSADSIRTTLWCWTTAGVAVRDALPLRTRECHPLDIVIVDRDAHAVWRSAFFAAYLAISETVTFDRIEHGATIAGMVRRTGRKAVASAMLLPARAGELIEMGLADARVAGSITPAAWLRQWVGVRSVPALVSAMTMLRHRLGGDVLERAEFARLFAIGDPQAGLTRFLDRQPRDFSDGTEWLPARKQE